MGVIATISRLRRIAAEQGYSIRQGRDASGMIGYRIIDTQLNRIECGEHYELDIEDVAKFLGEE